MAWNKVWEGFFHTAFLVNMGRTVLSSHLFGVGSLNKIMSRVLVICLVFTVGLNLVFGRELRRIHIRSTAFLCWLIGKGEVSFWFFIGLARGCFVMKPW